MTNIMISNDGCDAEPGVLGFYSN